MLVSFNSMISNNTQQKTNFGNIRTAGDTKDALMFALAAKDPAKKLTTEQAIKKINEAIEKEDSIGKKILENFKNALLGKNK